MDKSTDIENITQRLLFIRILDIDLLAVVDEYYLCCIDVGVITTAKQIFGKLNKFMTEKQIPWQKCCSLTTDGAVVMTRYWSGVGVRVKVVAINYAMKHCPIQQCYTGPMRSLRGLPVRDPYRFRRGRCNGTAWAYHTSFMWFKLFMQIIPFFKQLKRLAYLHVLIFDYGLKLKTKLNPCG